MKKLLLLAATFTGMVLLYGCDSNSSSSTPQYTVTLSSSPAEGGSVSSASQIYDEGSVATIAATPAGEWLFARWEGDFSGTSSTSTLTVDSDKNITAVFEKRNYGLTVNTSGEGTVDEQIIQAKTTDYESGTVLELTANPAEGWGFKEWEGALTGNSNPIQITVDDPKQVTAVFTQFYLAPNGVTVKCESAKVGAAETVNGITYTKRTVTQITSSNVATTCTSDITNMSFLFDQDTFFNEDISSWDVSAVTDMSMMFSVAVTFNGDISDWDVSSVTNMSGMFRVASNFNGDISSWDVSSVTNMNGMFSDADAFTGDISSWDVSRVTNLGAMFGEADSFNGDLSSWDLSSATQMSLMFFGAASFNSDIGGWNVSSVTDMAGMFASASSFNQNLSSWDVSAVANMDNMFFNASSFNQDLTGWCVTNIASEPSGFAGGSSALQSGNFPVWGTCPGS